MDMVYVRWDVVVALVLTGFNLACVGQAQCSPSNVVVSSITSTQVGISWECYDPSQTSEFNVTYILINKDQCYAEDALLNKPQTVDCMCCDCILSDSYIFSYWHELSGLDPYSTYTYTVESRVGSNTGRNHVDTFITEGEAPTDTPTDIAIKNKTHTGLTLTWNEPRCTHRNGNITYYTYSFKLTGSTFYIVQEQVTSDTEVTFACLSASTEHTFSVSANTVIGGGPVASLEATTLNAAPGTVTLSNIRISAGSQAGSVVIAWQVPDASLSDVTFYHIRYWKDDEVDNVVNQQIKANDVITMYTVNGLEQGSNYHFQIQAENTAGKGSWSEVYVFTVVSESGPNTGVIVGSSIAAIVVLFVVAVFIGYRLKMSNLNKSQPKTGNVQNTEIGMSSNSHSNTHIKAQQHTTSRGNDDDWYDDTDPQDQGGSTSGYYEDLDKTTINKDQEYQSIANNENQPCGYQNIAMSKDEGQTQATYDVDYMVPEPDGYDAHPEHYEEID